MTKEIIDIVKHLLKTFDNKLNQLHNQVTQEIVSTITTGSPVELATVATTGSYNDLEDKPDINPSMIYDTSLNSINTTVALGNIPINTPVSELKGKTFTQILDQVLFSEIYPSTTYSHTVQYSSMPTLIKEGTIINWPTVTATWNSNVLPISNIVYSESIKNPNNVVTSKNNSPSGVQTNVSGNWVYELKYSYPAGQYEVVSNYGNGQTRTVDAANNKTKTSTIKVTRPVYINGQEQSLIPLGTSTALVKSLGGSPVIKVPWAASQITIEVDLGFGYMPVNNWSETTETINGWEYKVFTKNDSYNTAVPHKFTITLNKD